MQNWHRPAALVAIVAAACSPSLAKAQEADFSFFEEALAPYGDWVNIDGYGACWHPDVENNWAPYTNGYWAYTDVGWTWVSHEAFGSIVFHYGRWLLSSSGWCWVPGSDWAPAWVSWRKSEDYIGWAPLPPEVAWQPQRGISSWVDVRAEIGPDYYRFCAVRDFCAPVLTEVLLRPIRNLAIMLRTENITSMTLHNNNVFCGGPQYGWMRERTTLDVPLLRVVREENVQRYYSLNIGGNFGTVQNFIHQDMLVLPGPRRVELAQSQPGRRMRTADLELSRGWSGDVASNERLRSHLSREWETRQSTSQRSSNSGSSRIYAPDIRVQPAAIQERRDVFSEITNRGGVIPPSIQAPRHPSMVSVPGRAVIPRAVEVDEETSDRPTSRRYPDSRPNAPVYTPSQGMAQPRISSPRPTTEQPYTPQAVPSPNGTRRPAYDAFSDAPTAEPAPRTVPRTERTLEPGTAQAPGNTSRTQPFPSRDGSPVSTVPSRTTPSSTGGSVQGSNRGQDTGTTNFPRPDPSTSPSSIRRSPEPPPRQDLSRQETTTPSRTVQPPALQQPVITTPTRQFSSTPTQGSAPTSGARSTVIPPPSPPQEVPQQPIRQAPSTPTSSMGGGQRSSGAPAGVPQGVTRGGAPAPGASAPAGSGVSISTTPAPAQGTTKKKPGDPGYVPGPGQ